MPLALTTVGSVLLGIVSGKSVQTLERPARDNELGILKVSAVTWGSFRPNENKALPPSYDPKDCPRPMDGDILISRANTRELVGAPVMVHGDYPHLLLSDKLLKLLPDESAVDARYLVRALRSPSASAHFFQCAGGSSGSMTNITQSDIRSAPIYLPSLEEQRRIAAILDQAEALRTQRRTALALLDSLTQSLFLDMFGDPVANPKGWPVKPVSSLGKVVTGNTPSRDVSAYYGNSVEWIKSDNLNTPHYYVTKATEGLSEAGKAVGRLVPPNSILVTCIAGSPDCIGNAAMADREVAFNQQINAFIPVELDAHFAYTQIVVGKKLIQGASTNGMKGMVSKSRFEAIEFMVPPLPLQQTFATRIASIEALKATHRRALAALDALFASLQQRAFAGQL